MQLCEFSFLVEGRRDLQPALRELRAVRSRCPGGTHLDRVLDSLLAEARPPGRAPTPSTCNN